MATDDFAFVDESSEHSEQPLRGPLALRQWLQAAPPDFSSSTGLLDLRFAEIVEFRDGKIARMRAFASPGAFLRELGLTSVSMHLIDSERPA